MEKDHFFGGHFLYRRTCTQCALPNTVKFWGINPENMGVINKKRKGRGLRTSINITAHFDIAPPGVFQIRFSWEARACTAQTAGVTKDLNEIFITMSLLVSWAWSLWRWSNLKISTRGCDINRCYGIYICVCVCFDGSLKKLRQWQFEKNT